jgi:hypothetical protein
MRKIEEVARALANHIHHGGDYGMTGEEAYEDRRDDYLAMARAAIEAMREPTEWMLCAGRPYAGVAASSASKTFSAMIDAALNGKEG